ncbi:ABC-2 type transport system ATP-binding protein [Thermocatellispora tengchongensis]|uniref:ABC-2 type transport system ATP-binding protein n=1 Tax=Thermocatellispora tengchongensis TaxID=1073253 RepID=A0A840P5G8_9ACTN|nr:ATP-binding cassette domain-containing protein [Thermocatellispora tengchongensis]MBB5133796.1 ABC-2 type transport system ATP-binding protein [Thermocatellispora tengchongensis]
MLEAEDLHKRYGDTIALRGVALRVRPGEMFGFVGANGAGKTTTMRIVMGVLGPDSGEVRWRGEPVTAAARRGFGYMPEERGLYQKMRVAEQIAYFGRLHGMTAAEAKSATGALMERLGLTERAGDPVEALSLGNQQRVQLAVALVHDPTLLVLDEPFSGLDPIAVDALAEVLAERCRAGVPVIFSSHQLDLVERLCDSVGIIAAGRMVAAGPVEEVRAAEGRRSLRVVVRDPAPGWADGLPGEVTADGDGRQVLRTTEGDDQAILAAASRAGRVEHFGWEQPTLTEIFREAVA